MESLLMLFCLLSLQVVAPVRENCAQTLGVTLHHVFCGGDDGCHGAASATAATTVGGATWWSTGTQVSSGCQGGE